MGRSHGRRGGSGEVNTRQMHNVGPRGFFGGRGGEADDGKRLDGYVRIVHLRYFLLYVN